MSEEHELLKKRFVELGKKSYNSGIFVFTSFLGLAEQSAFSEIKKELLGISYMAFGGVTGCERVMIRFGSEEELGYELPFPIDIIKVEPLSQKFADKLTHRDFLGSILNLGIERDVLGDIVIRDNIGYVFASEDISEYICDSLTRIKHTDVRATRVDTLPDTELFRTETRVVQTNGERLDAIVAKLFSLSREDASALFKKRLVFVSGKCTENTSYIPKENEVVSVRGHGRFIYRGYDSLTKKGKKNIKVDLYV